MSYPVPPEMPCHSDNILALLAAAAKYDMDAVQSSIRAEISRRGLLSPTGAEVFRMYAIAYSKGLIPEVATAARLTLGYPLTFEYLGDTLRSFEGWALRDLADFRQRSIDKFCSNWNSFSDYIDGPSEIWVYCPTGVWEDCCRLPPTWIEECLQLKLTTRFNFLPKFRPEDRFTETIPTSDHLCDKYLKALQSHVEEDDCHVCMRVHTLEGEDFCAKMKEIAAQAWNVPPPMSGERPESPKIESNS